jgi:hypothetical protein
LTITKKAVGTGTEMASETFFPCFILKKNSSKFTHFSNLQACSEYDTLDRKISNKQLQAPTRRMSESRNFQTP